jgi:hypothetical protein
MAGEISTLTALTGANTATGDLLEIVDVSDTTMAATGTNKKITRVELQAAVSGLGAAIFGDGSDGDVTISSNTSLAADMYYNNLTVNSGVTLSTNGYRLFVRGTLTVEGSIADNGSTGGGTRAGTSAYNGAWAGGSGGTTTGTAGSSGSAGPGGGNGGAGGTGSGGAGGAGGTNSTAYLSVYGANKQLRNLAWVIGPHGNGVTAQALEGGSGGGGGGGNSTQAGGAGGSGGGIVLTAARVLAGSGSITANGGAGANATNTNTGGGGGGGGGRVFLVSTATTVGSLTVTANGGAGGSGNGTGTNGTAGVAGTVISLLGV